MIDTSWLLCRRAAQRIAVVWRSRKSAAIICGEQVWRGSTTAPNVALTFDDGPDARWTPAILQALNADRARGTFFLIGSRILAEPELARLIAATHEVGTHLFSHRRGLTRDRAAFRSDLQAALAAHRQILEEPPTWLRFPFGDAGRVTPTDWQSAGLTACHWSLNSQDVRTDDPAEILRQVVPHLRPGAIVLLHDGMGADWRLGPGHRQATVAALPGILAAIRDRGLRTVTLTELGVSLPSRENGSLRRAA